MILLSSLRGKHTGRPAAVLGGGPSLVEDLTRIPADAILIAVNYHAFHHLPSDRLPMYMVYNDAPETNPLQLEEVQKHRSIHVSPAPERTSDVEFDMPEVWTGSYSSNTATWLALWMDCNPVILCGMDCYQGPVKHCPPSTYHSAMFDYPLDFYLRPWVEDCRNSVLHPERIRAVSGPLVNVFGVYEASHVVEA